MARGRLIAAKITLKALAPMSSSPGRKISFVNMMSLESLTAPHGWAIHEVQCTDQDKREMMG